MYLILKNEINWFVMHVSELSFLGKICPILLYCLGRCVGSLYMVISFVIFLFFFPLSNVIASEKCEGLEIFNELVSLVV